MTFFVRRCVSVLQSSSAASWHCGLCTSIAGILRTIVNRGFGRTNFWECNSLMQTMLHQYSSTSMTNKFFSAAIFFLHEFPRWWLTYSCKMPNSLLNQKVTTNVVASCATRVDNVVASCVIRVNNVVGT